jgi:hypothetical protein
MFVDPISKLHLENSPPTDRRDQVATRNGSSALREQVVRRRLRARRQTERQTARRLQSRNGPERAQFQPGACPILRVPAALVHKADSRRRGGALDTRTSVCVGCAEMGSTRSQRGQHSKWYGSQGGSCRGQASRLSVGSGVVVNGKWKMAGFHRINTYPFIHLGLTHAILNIVSLTPLLERFESEYGTLTTLALFTGRRWTLWTFLTHARRKGPC